MKTLWKLTRRINIHTNYQANQMNHAAQMTIKMFTQLIRIDDFSILLLLSQTLLNFFIVKKMNVREETNYFSKWQTTTRHHHFLNLFDAFNLS